MAASRRETTPVPADSCVSRRKVRARLAQEVGRSVCKFQSNIPSALFYIICCGWSCRVNLFAPRVHCSPASTPARRLAPAAVMSPSTTLSILVPSFIHSSPGKNNSHSPASSTMTLGRKSFSDRSSTRKNSLSLASGGYLRPPTLPIQVVQDPSPPPDFLLGDDPFANLTPVEPVFSSQTMPSPSRSSYSYATMSPPRPNRSTSSPLLSRKASASSLSPPSIPTIQEPLPKSRRVKPAYTRPAFRPRPSLPSLRDLEQSVPLPPPRVCSFFIYREHKIDEVVSTASTRYPRRSPSP